MKKQSWALYTLTGAAIISLSACQPITSLGDMWSSNSDYDNTPNNTASPTTSKAPQPTTTTSSHPGGVQVPSSYYLANGAPISHQDVDKNWVDQQSSSGYTIQLATGKASSVAQTLQAAPKDQRMAQVQYNSDGKPMYMGIYGTFDSKSDAEAALAKLPPSLQQSAQVQSWSNVQEAADSAPSPSAPSIAPPDVG